MVVFVLTKEIDRLQACRDPADLKNFVDGVHVSVAETGAVFMRSLGDHLALMGGDTPLPKGFSLSGFSPQALFAFADRRCRIEVDAAALDLLLRSSASRALGQGDAALADLRTAFQRNADDVIVCRSILALDPDDARKGYAAEGLLANPRAANTDLDAALRHLLSTGSEVAVRAYRIGDMLRGWVARTSAAAPDVRMSHEEGSEAVVLTDLVDHPFLSFTGHLSSFAFTLDARQPVEITATGQGGGSARALIYATEPPVLPDAGLEKPHPVGAPAKLNVIVPLYRDHEAAKACLEALALQDCATPLQIYIVDDRSPEPDISALAERFCRLHDATLIVNRVNHGFAGAVNRALSRCEDGDALLLNSDVTLPPGALDRLVATAYGSDRIGTVMPLSNDSELTSFPIPFKPNPLPSADLALRIDDAARRAHGDATIDIVNTIGYCVYVTRECLRATGLLSQRYGRGYYEDVELALKAREKGFRNVAAVGLYVAHGSGRSFQDGKGALVSHNLPILCDRFPAFKSENIAFAKSDPLRKARGAIEVHLPPVEPTHLLVGAAAPPGSPLGLRARRIAEEGGFVLMLSWRQLGASTSIDIVAPAGFGPRSITLTLDPDGLDILNRYILGLRLVQIELGDLHTIPSPLYRLLLRTSAPILFFIASLEDALLVNAGVPPSGQERLTSRDITVDFLGFDRDSELFAYRIPQFLMRTSSSGGSSKFVTSDAMAEAVCADLKHRADPLAKPSVHRPARWQAKRVVAVPVPLASSAVDRLLLDLARHLRSRVTTELVVMGRCLDDRALMAVGNVIVSGHAAQANYPLLLAAHGADALFLPYRTSMFGVLEALSAVSSLPRAYFDWSAGLMPYGPDDVVLDCRLPGDQVQTEFARWCVDSAGAA